MTVTPSIGTYDSNTGIWTIPQLLNGELATLKLLVMQHLKPQLRTLLIKQVRLNIMEIHKIAQQLVFTCHKLTLEFMFMT